MATTLTATDLGVTITESINLNDYEQGSTNSFIISSINEISKRIVTVPQTATDIILFGTSIANGTYITADVRYIRLTNLDDENYIVLNIETEAVFSIRLDPGASFIITSTSSTGVAAYADTAGSTLEDLEKIQATANNSSCDIEIFLASA